MNAPTLSVALKIYRVFLILFACTFFAAGAMSVENLQAAAFFWGFAFWMTATAFHPVALTTPKHGFRWNLMTTPVKLLHAAAYACMVFFVIYGAWRLLTQGFGNS